MSPLKYGTLVAEIYNTTLLTHKYCILLDLPFTQDLLLQLFRICTLRDYLSDLKGTSVSIETMLSPKSSNNLTSQLGLKLAPFVDTNRNFDQQILEIAASIDTDIIVTNSSFDTQTSFNESKSRIISSDIEKAKSELEVFVRGHEIPWSFSDPVWFMPWSSFYTMCDNYGKQAWKTYSTLIAKSKLSLEAQEVLRSLFLNRITNICYTKDKLLFYSQQRSFAMRNQFDKQDYKFEAGYFLTNYYFLIWGGIDQLSFILNDLLGLGLEGLGTSVTNERFRNHVFSKSKAIGQILIKKEFLEWFDKLKRIRHFVAHKGNVILSDLMAEPEKELSAIELENEMNDHPYANTVRQLHPDELRNTFWEMLRQQVRVSKMKKLADDAMIIDVDEKRYLYYPLRDVEYEFNTLKQFIEELLPHLK